MYLDEAGDMSDTPSTVEVVSLGHHTVACPYLPDKVATFHFVAGPAAATHYRALMDSGFRRSGPYFYRPQCAQCNACKVLRVPIQTFRPSKGQRRIYRKGAARFDVSMSKPGFTPEKAAVYGAYLAYQHGSEEAVEQDQYENFLVESVAPVETLEMQFRHEGRLVGVGIVDYGVTYLSSVYFYFDPDYASYSLGTFSAMYEIELARALRCSHYYLGYYIAACPAMAYKARFKPCQWKDPDSDTWHLLDREGDDTGSAR